MKTPIFDNSSGISEEECLAIYDNSYDFYVSVLKAFYKESLETAEKMKRALEAGEYEEYRIMVHGLKGSSGAIGAHKLLELATVANEKLKAKDIEGGTAYNEEILDEIKRIRGLISDNVLNI